MQNPEDARHQGENKHRRWLLESAMEQTTAGIAVADLNGNLLLVNRAFANSHGYQPEELLGQHLAIFHTPAQMSAVDAANRQLWDEGEFVGEIQYRHRNGTVFGALTSHSLLRDENGKPVAMIRTIADISERAKTEQALRLNEARLEALVQLGNLAEASTQEIADFALEEAVRLTSSQIGYVGSLSEDGAVFTIHSWSSSVMDACQMKDQDVAFQMATLGLLAEPARQRKPVVTNDYAAANPLKSGCPAGHLQIVRHMSIPVFDGDRVVAMAGVGNKPLPYDDADVRQLSLLMDGLFGLMQRKQQQEELRIARDFLEERIRQRTAEIQRASDALREQMQARRELEKEVLSISAREQVRIGQELHDGLGQELTGLGYLAESLYTEIKSRDPSAAEVADRLVGGIQQAMDRARSIAKGLMLVELHEDGLAAALSDLAVNAEPRYGVPCTFRCEGPPMVEDATTCHQLIRVAQEAVSNAIRHAHPTQIAIELKQDPNGVRLSIMDDGIGIDKQVGEGSGLGLRIMEHRASTVGAELQIDSATGGGTTVVCYLPIATR